MENNENHGNENTRGASTIKDVWAGPSRVNDSGSKKSEFGFESLQAVRNKLLDLSGRNQLLNYKHPKASCVRIIDELPDQLFDELQRGKTFTFIPVADPTEKQLIAEGYLSENDEGELEEVKPYPSADQWAKYLGFDTNYELPSAESANESDGKHQDLNIQTLLYAHQLEARLRTLRGKAETAIEESGSNILYLVLGFLEMYESHDSDSSRIAPLFALPVRLERKKLDRDQGVFRYAITLKDEGLITNITLKEKLAGDFDLVLPGIDDDTAPEAYFSEISDTLLRHQPRWRIHRKATLAILNFTKQVMYEDLDPGNWPENNRIEEHPTIKQFFASQTENAQADVSGFIEEYEIDTIDAVHEHYPLIFDADSSQHSALIDAVQGECLVIEGPPGSGKSQTITNLIAACIANGKKVLFVAEKMAALDVVKNRLDRAGLGDFCLELHSHKTQKQRLLLGLKNRLDNQGRYRSPREIESDIARYEDLKHKLNKYVALINSHWKETGLSLHEIFNTATRYREELGKDPACFVIEKADGQSLSIVRRKELADYAEMLANIFTQVQEQASGNLIANHHWYGVNNADLSGHQQTELAEKLAVWNQGLLNIQKVVEEVTVRFGIDVELLEDFEQISLFSASALRLPELIGGESLHSLPELVPQKDDLRESLDQYEQAYKDLERFQKFFRTEAITNHNTSDLLGAALNELKALGLMEAESLAQPHKDFTAIREADKKARSMADQLTLIEQKLPETLKELCSGSASALLELSKFIGLVSQLSAELWRHRDEIYDVPEMDDLLDQMTGRFNVLLPLHKELAEHFKLADLPPAKILSDLRDVICNAGIFSFFTKRWWVARRFFFSLAASVQPNKKQLKSMLPKLADYKKGLEEIDQINLDSQSLGAVYQGMETPLERVLTLRDWYRAVRAEYGRGLGPRARFAEQLFSMDRDLALALADLNSNGFANTISNVLADLETMRQRYNKHQHIANQTQQLTQPGSPLQRLLVDIQKPLKVILSSLKGESCTLAEVAELARGLKLHQEEVVQWSQKAVVMALSPEPLLLEIAPGKRNPPALAVARNFLEIAQACATSPAIFSILLAQYDSDHYQRLREVAQPMVAALQQERQEWQNFECLGKVNEAEWRQVSKGKLALLLERNRRALANPNWLNTWLDYLRVRRKLTNEGMQQILAKLEEGELTTESLSDLVEMVLMHQLAEEIFIEEPFLAEFTGLEQMAVRERFCEYDKKLLALQRDKIAYRAGQTNPPGGNASGKVGSYTEIALIKHESGKKTRHIAVRALIERAGKAIQALKPCFMMSPMSVAQYIAPGNFEFDIVVMDEASQIRPEDALGAIARGKSLVVVGDPKQLPPTSFFEKVANDEFDEDTVALEESESILESAIPMFKTRRLRWHYRSRHESLIAFSNQNYYHSNLVIFPSPHASGNEFGIRYHLVKRGRFSRGKNAEEARVIAKAALDQLLSRPHESVGLVAMNAEQRNEIEMHVEQLIKEEPGFQAAVDKNMLADEPLFIKNLENVQGDERDVIMISMTYGPDEVGGRVFQRFGPINKDVGWRRLNVLFTRSKKRMHVYSSMSSHDIQVSGTSKRGVQSLKAFLEYCESGHLYNAASTYKEPDSDFEVAVIEGLKRHGYECEPQLGVAGYYLDLAVRDPGSPGGYLMGVECDGATYHSAKSARDRDRLRQEILESLGWRIRRIWSTDWFKNPEAQLQPILNELAKLRTESPALTDQQHLPVPGDEEREVTKDEIDASEGLQALESELKSQGEPMADCSLRTLLAEFDKDVVRKEYPKTPQSNRLLRSAMLEALLHHLPTSKEEFTEVIPGYLRKATDIHEAKDHLDGVLEIIADYG